jgi:condensin complex subunit 3
LHVNSIHQQIALDSFGVFVHQVQAAEIDLRIKVLKIVFDLLLQHGIDFLAEKGHGVRPFTLPQPQGI